MIPNVEYSFESGSLDLIPDGKMNLAVVLNEDEWLLGTTIIDCIDSREIELQDDCSLLIEDSIAPGPCHSNVNVIRDNILYSGTLVVL